MFAGCQKWAIENNNAFTKGAHKPKCEILGSR